MFQPWVKIELRARLLLKAWQLKIPWCKTMFQPFVNPCLVKIQFRRRRSKIKMPLVCKNSSKKAKNPRMALGDSQ
ncbi:hypothetical protein ACFXTO_016825 [Malus domestica]